MGTNIIFTREYHFILDLNSVNIISDIAEQFAYSFVPKKEIYTFLDKIIYYGKILYYKDLTTNLSDRYKIGYSKDKINGRLKMSILFGHSLLKIIFCLVLITFK